MSVEGPKQSVDAAANDHRASPNRSVSILGKRSFEHGQYQNVQVE
jgi:hypothetical protein